MAENRAHKTGKREAGSARGRSPVVTPSPVLPERGPGGEATPHFERGMSGPERRRLCRELRRKQTPAETLFWQLVRDRRFDGHKFRRQHPLGNFIADFYCPELRLAIELDGGVHTKQRERDSERETLITQHGIRVLRVRNQDLVADPKATLEDLRSIIVRDSLASLDTSLDRLASPSPASLERGPGGEAT